ncbi:uncharacterized protein V1510DRAFT_414925 [Dipodascopsis tothii]|uniref:uncharacterized protein n=1 Tax=Dipodascopsis tothii TaxID=44089 RepID=UPI0034CF5A2E
MCARHLKSLDRSVARIKLSAWCSCVYQTIYQTLPDIISTRSAAYQAHPSTKHCLSHRFHQVPLLMLWTAAQNQGASNIAAASGSLRWLSAGAPNAQPRPCMREIFHRDPAHTPYAVVEAVAVTVRLTARLGVTPASLARQADLAIMLIVQRPYGARLCARQIQIHTAHSTTATAPVYESTERLKLQTAVPSGHTCCSSPERTDDGGFAPARLNPAP